MSEWFREIKTNAPKRLQCGRPAAYWDGTCGYFACAEHFAKANSGGWVCTGLPISMRGGSLSYLKLETKTCVHTDPLPSLHVADIEAGAA